MADHLAALYDRVDAPVREAFEQATGLAEQRGLRLYLVGGAVRDLLLGSTHLDLDLVVEGDAIVLATESGKRLNDRVTSHSRFGTATVAGAGYQLDFAGARAERYERPGALPSVSPADLTSDLARRDFTINAMAIALTGEGAGRLIDQHGGKADLRSRLIRVLHDRSFQDDATRILRAVRYAGRLSFHLERGTARLLRRDLAYLDTVSGTRLRHELERIAHEERVANVMRLAVKVGVFEALSPPICVSVRQVSTTKRMPAEVSPGQREAIIFCLMSEKLSKDQTEAFIRRLSLTGRQASAVRAMATLLREKRRLAKPKLRPSEIVALLSTAPVDAVEAFRLLAGDAVLRDRLRRYLDEWRFVRPRLNGRDIEALGVAHGPRVGAALDALRTARLDGVVSTRDDEVVFVETFRRRPTAGVRRHRG